MFVILLLLQSFARLFAACFHFPHPFSSLRDPLVPTVYAGLKVPSELLLTSKPFASRRVLWLINPNIRNGLVDDRARQNFMEG